MLKPAKTPGTRRSNSTAAIRLFRVLEVEDNGLVVRFLNDRGQDAGLGYLEATPNFVSQKDKAPNFVAKSVDGKRNPRFYKALMRPTSNPDHVIKSGTEATADVVSAKLYVGDQTFDHPKYGKIEKAAIGGGFNIFARNTMTKRDPLDDSLVNTVPADRIIIGRGRLVTDVNGDRTNQYFEVVSELGHPESLEGLYADMRDLASSKQSDARGLLYIRVQTPDGESTGSVKPESLAETETTISDIQSLGLTPDKISVFHSHGRIYVNEDFMVAQGNSRSKYERFLSDIERGLGVNLEETPVTTKTEERTYQGKTQRVAGASYAIPVALSRTMYLNKDTSTFVPGALRSIVPLSGDVIPSNHLYKTPEQRAAAVAKAAEAGAAAPEQDVPQHDAPAAPSADVPVAGADIDFGFGSKE